MQSTARPDKNKPAAEPLTQALNALDRELEWLLVSLESYSRSRHSGRFEVLRPHLSRLDDCLARLGAQQEAEPAAVAEREAVHSRID